MTTELTHVLQRILWEKRREKYDYMVMYSYKIYENIHTHIDALQLAYNAYNPDLKRSGFNENSNLNRKSVILGWYKVKFM